MSHSRASFSTQANALIRKNFTFQKRNIKGNIRLVLFPFLICVLLVLIQALINSTLDRPKYRCGCTCVVREREGPCQRVCGIEHSTLDQARSCSIPNPPEWPALLQIPAPEYRATNTDLLSFKDLPNESCRRTGSCPAVLLFTGINQSFGEGLAFNFSPDTFSLNTSDITGSAAYNVLGTSSKTETNNFLDPAFSSSLPLYYTQLRCVSNSTFSVPIRRAPITMNKDIKCVQATPLWRNSTSEINDELYKGYLKGNDGRMINEIITAYDFLNTNQKMFNVTIWYNSTYKNDTGSSSIALVRVPRSINLVSNAYLQFLQGRGTKILLDFVKEMPKAESVLRLDISSLLGTLFFTWVVLQLFPVVLTSLVYERQQNLRIMMKMHGLGDGPYWMISYAYFLLISFAYMICFVVFGSVIGLKFFTLNDYSIQSVFYFIYINLQLSLAFLTAGLFSNVKTASVVAYIFVFGTGLLGGFLFQFFLEDDSFPRGWIIVMELYPGFSLYRGLYEFAQYSFTGNFMGRDGMLWKDLNDNSNGMKAVLIIMFLEWLLILFSAFYIDQVLPSRRGLFSYCASVWKRSATLRLSSFKRQGSEIRVPLEKDDVIEEMEKVEHLLGERHTDYAIICNNLQKVYHGKDGNPGKLAVRGLYLALRRGECFGMLGPNGAGKTSFINMMIGLTKPTTGTALVNGLDIQSEMSEIYSSMGVCPQHDLLWETLTGREHLLFYGRLKNLKGDALTLAVEESLKSVKLFFGGVADRQTGKYSGGMKRRLSVAISLIGDPKVVYMDEPSTGLDPASRNNLWNVVKRAKRDRAIILTTHSMEEAEVLCDRLGIFVDGSFQCLGNPRELKARYGGCYVFTMTTSPENDEEVEKMVRSISPSAKRVYHISGTQKFELAKPEVRMADVFRAVENAKSRFVVHAWGIADTTLEDVFIKVARGARVFNALS